MELQINYDLSKIRIKCAEIVGWRDCCVATTEAYWRPGDVIGQKPNEIGWSFLPNYPESADAALELVAWMSKPENGEWWPDASHNYPDREWSFALTYGTDVCHGVADTFPLAVCLAFLKANNIDPETL